VGTVALTEATFEQTIAENDIVLVDWWASWCGPCRMFAPVFDAAAAQHTDIVFAKIDTETEQALAGAAGIMSIPTLMAFREGVLIFSQPGALPAPALEDLITQVRALDMEVVRGEILAGRRAVRDRRQAARRTRLSLHSDTERVRHREPRHGRRGRGGSGQQCLG
jgi:thioredoxin 1